MSSLIEKLANLELRIQSLIERGTAPSLSQAGNISSRLVAAMKSSIKTDASGQSIAADLYILTVDLETAHLLLENQRTG